MPTVRRANVEVGVKVDQEKINQFNRALDRMTKSGGNVQKTMNKMTNQLKDFKNHSELFSKQYEKTFGRVTESNKQALKSNREFYNNSVRGQKRLRQALKETESVDNQTTNTANINHKKRINQNNNLIKSHKTLQGRIQKLNSSGDKLINTGRSMSLTSLGVGAAFLKGAKDAVKLQHQYRVVNNLAETGGEKRAEAQKNVNKMTKQGEKYSLQYGVSQKTLGKGYEELIRRGYDSNQALAAQKTLLQGSLASGDDYTKVLEGATGAVESFGLRSKDTTQMTKNTKMAVNQLAYSADLTATDFDDMTESMKYVGPAAKAAHQDIAGVSSSLGLLSNYNIKGSTAGTSMRQIIDRLVAPPKKGRAVDAMKQMGLSSDDFRDAKGNLLSIQDIFTKMNDHMKGMNSTQRGAIFNGLFGQTAQNAGTVLSEHVNKLKDLNKQVSKSQNMNNGKGYIDKLSQMNLQSAESQMKRFKSTLDDLGITFANTILPNVTKLTGGLNDMLKKVAEAPSWFKKFVSYGAVFIAGIAPVTLVIGSIKKAFGGVLTSIEWLRKQFSTPLSNRMTGSAVAQSEAMQGAYSGVGQNPTTTRSSRYQEQASNVYTTRAGKSVGRTDKFRSRFGGIKSTGTKLGKVGNLDTIAGKAGTSFASKAFNAIAIAGMAVDFGKTALDMFSSNMSSNQKLNEGFKTGGTIMGGALGSIAGPFGTAIGAYLGNKAGDILSKTINPVHQRYDSIKDKSKNKKGFGDQLLTSIGDMFSGKGTQFMNETNGDKGNNTSNPKPKTISASQAYKNRQDSMLMGVNKKSQKLLQSNAKLISQANAGWISTQVSSTRNLSKKQKDALTKQLDLSQTSYNQLIRDSTKFANNQTKKYQKNGQKLVKNGFISQDAYSKAISKESQTNNKRVQDIRNTISKIKQSEDNGGKGRNKLIRRLNQQMFRLTGNDTKKQKQAYRNMLKSTTTLNGKQYQDQLKDARKNYKSQVSYANKTYSAKVTKANADYNSAKSYAKKAYGVHSQQYRDAVQKAKDQRDGVVNKARRQKNDTVRYAEAQRDGVTQAAKDAANDVVKEFNSILDDIKNHDQFSKVFGKKKKPPKKFHTALSNENKNIHDLNSGKAGKKGYKSHNNGQLVTNPFDNNASGTKNAKKGSSLLGENGMELVQRGKKFYQVGKNGAEIFNLKSNDIVYNNHQVQSMIQGNYHKRMPNFAKGNAKFSNPQTKLHASNKITGSFTSSSINRMKKQLSFSPKLKFKVTNRDVLKDLIPTKTLRSFKHSISSISSQLNSLRKSSSQIWKNIANHQLDSLNDINSQGTKKIKQLKNSLNGALDNIGSNWSKSWTSITKKFDSIFGKLDNYAHSGMKGAIKQLNNGIGGIDKSLSQFGGKDNVISPIHYANGVNSIPNEQIAMVNDAKHGSHQEAIISKNGNIRMPKGRNVITKLQKGDSVLNGKDTLIAQRKGLLPKYASGAGSKEALSKLIKDNHKNSSKAFNNDFFNKINVTGSKLQKGETCNAKQGSKPIVSKWYKSFWSLMNKSLNGDDYKDNKVAKQISSQLKWVDKNLLSASNPTGTGVKRWTSLVKRALGMNRLSQSSSMVQRVLSQMQTESGGNPRAIGGTDGLADGRATGLMQTKPGTFKAHAFKGHNNIFNGFDNLLSALSYAKGKYGPDLSFLGHGHGYANGGWANKPGIFGEVKGQPEVAINPKRNTADNLIGEAITARVKENKQSPFAKLLESRKASKERKSLKTRMNQVMSKSGKVAQAPQFVLNQTFNITGGADKDTATDIAKEVKKQVKATINQMMLNSADKLGIDLDE